MKKYAVHPGYVYSRDGDYHYISIQTLMELYQVDPQDCIIWDDARRETFLGRHIENYIHLYPSDSGNYSLPNHKEDDV